MEGTQLGALHGACPASGDGDGSDVASGKVQAKQDGLGRSWKSTMEARTQRQAPRSQKGTSAPPCLLTAGGPARSQAWLPRQTAVRARLDLLGTALSTVSQAPLLPLHICRMGVTSGHPTHLDPEGVATGPAAELGQNLHRCSQPEWAGDAPGHHFIPDS